MKDVTAVNMLNAWELALHQPPLQRALILLASTFPEIPADTLAELSIGRRDRLLMQLRQYLFGHQFVNTAVCPECGERVEWENRIEDFLIPPDENNSLKENRFDLKEGDYFLSFRLPNSLDIAAVMNTDKDVETQQRNLLSRCILEVENCSAGSTVDDLPDFIFQELTKRIKAEDPQAEIRIHLACPECSHSWEVLFDIGSFLWTELNNWAEQILLTVHRLAMGYGWSERDILNLSPVRRQFYLGMLGT